MKWRKWNNIIHRDLGYLCVGMTLIYAISGVAVNHTHQWNPSYRIERTVTDLEMMTDGEAITGATIRDILRRLGESPEYKDTYQIDPKTLQIFQEGLTVTVNLQTGEVVRERVRSRTGLREMNFLHLNHPKKLWTWMADLYAVCLAVLTVTGLFVLKGKKGITGRGAWLTAAGILLPVGFLLLYL